MPRTLPEPSVDSFDLTVVLSALADPGRRTLMRALYESVDPIDCAILVARVDLGLSNPTISHHYRVLREAGLTRTVADGRNRVVRVRREDMEHRFPGLLQAILGASERSEGAGEVREERA
ncbi:ArsR/SmtB family transcription factor [Streptomyces sp. RGM 3693]|uniref:ArsR/SmtB family transcription factor n=1 Tax=Streptomyces sp. RGM 3693 TaxID=3413284 RepID=UPI003D2C7120